MKIKILCENNFAKTLDNLVQSRSTWLQPFFSSFPKIWKRSESSSNWVAIFWTSVTTGSGIPASLAALNPKLFGQAPKQ